MSATNPILSYIGDIPVKKINHIRLTLNEHDFKRLAEVAYKTGLSFSSILAALTKPCDKCGNENSTIILKRGILSTNKANNGRSTINRLNYDKQK